MAFHPDYEENGLFYVNYTDLNGHTRVVEYEATTDEPRRRRELLFVEQPYANHNGGQVAFGPDGLLYVGMGDGGSSGDPENRAQDLDSQLGKLLRYDVDAKGKQAWEMVAYGLRNPWRFSFDRETGDLWIGDVGQGEIEEIDYLPSGTTGLVNFGWDVFEELVRTRRRSPSQEASSSTRSPSTATPRAARSRADSSTGAKRSRRQRGATSTATTAAASSGASLSATDARRRAPAQHRGERPVVVRRGRGGRALPGVPDGLGLPARASLARTTTLRPWGGRELAGKRTTTSP